MCIRDRDFTVVGWETGAGSAGRSFLTAREAGSRNEWVLTGLIPAMKNGGTRELGVLILAPPPDGGPSAPPPVAGDFLLRAGEIMTAEGTIESLVATAGKDLTPAMRPGFQRAYPNPFNPEVTIEYALVVPARVTLRIHDLAGRLVATLVDEDQVPGAGNLSAVWDGKNRHRRRVSSGVYFWRLAIGERVETGRMMLIN